MINMFFVVFLLAAADINLDIHSVKSFDDLKNNALSAYAESTPVDYSKVND